MTTVLESVETEPLVVKIAIVCSRDERRPVLLLETSPGETYGFGRENFVTTSWSGSRVA